MGWAFVHQPSCVSYSMAIILCTYVDDVPQQVMVRDVGSGTETQVVRFVQ